MCIVVTLFAVALKRISVDLIDDKARDKCLKEVSLDIVLSFVPSFI